MDTNQTMDAMGRTSIQTSEELADELWERKNRGESYEDVIWRLIEMADANEQDNASEHDRHVDEANKNEVTPEPAVDTTPKALDPVTSVVDRVSDNWGDTEERMRARRAAARAVLQHAVDTGEAVGKADAIEQFLPQHAVDGQGDETWWRKNIRPVLKAVGEYSNGKHGYVVEESDLEE